MSSKSLSFPSFFQPAQPVASSSTPTQEQAKTIADVAFLTVKQMSPSVAATPPTPVTPNAAPVVIPQTAVPEFEEMRATAAKIKKWEVMSKEGLTTFTRDVERGYLPGETTAALYVKKPVEEANVENAPYEELGYLISKKFELNCVPPTLYVEGETSFVVQKGVTAAAKQPFNGDYEIDPASVQRAMFFNIITGRKDGHVLNTIKDTSQKAQESDNEGVGFVRTDSWLFDRFETMPLDPKVSQALTKFDEDHLVEVFADFKSRHPGVVIPESNMARNFLFLKTDLMLPKHPTVKQLKKKYWTQAGPVQETRQ